VLTAAFARACMRLTRLAGGAESDRAANAASFELLGLHLFVKCGVYLDVFKMHTCVKIVLSGLVSAGLPCSWLDMVIKCRFTRQLVLGFA